MNSTIALVGNPNVGKTSLFNSLTKTYQKVGNWTGVTVEKKQLPLFNNKNIIVVDLPGAYSLNGTTIDEKVVPKYLVEEKPNVIINIVDGTNLERNLSLTLSLIKLKIPTILAINFCDELEKNNVKIDKAMLSNILGIPVVFISAKKNKGIKELTKLASEYSSIPSKNFSLTEKEICEKVYKKENLKSAINTEKIDNVVLSKIFGLPIFVFVVFLVYFLSLKVGGICGEYISTFFDSLKVNTTNSLVNINCPEFLITFLTVAILGGIGEVMSFLPQILILFGLLAILEESGYMSRVAFLLDRIFRFFGLSGKSVFALVLSLGCTVSGVMATRTIEDEKEREKTIFLIPFMPCGAKIVVIAWVSKIFFNSSPFIATSLFFLGLVVIVLMGKFTLKGKGEDFLLEMPYYRAPSIKNIFAVMMEKIKDFTYKAGSIIFMVSIVYWLLLYFGLSGYNGGNLEDSFLFYLGSITKYLFYPLGFYDERISISIISGLLARESIIETLSMSVSNFALLFNNGFGVYSFLSFILLSPPCFATLSAAKSELKSGKKLAKMFAFEFFVAYFVAFIFRLVSFIT